jgi:hypothetical protein
MMNKIIGLVGLILMISTSFFAGVQTVRAAEIGISIEQGYLQETFVNQTVNISALPLSGTPPYTYQWYTQLWTTMGGSPIGGIVAFPNATSSTFTFIESIAGTYDISLQINDSAGNGDYDSFPISGVWVIVQPLSSSSQISTQSNFNPTISIVYPTNGTVVDANMGAVSINWQYPANSTFSWVGYSLNGGGNVTVTGKDHLFDIENDGDYTFTLYANDTTGNWATPQTVTYHVHVIGDALQEKPIAVVVIIALILAVIILFALAVLVAYRRNRKTQNK